VWSGNDTPDADDLSKKDITMRIYGTLIAALGLALTAVASTAAPVREAASAEVKLDHGSIVANGIRLHYVTAGQGDPVLLIPGWPESWSAWRSMIPLFVKAGRKAYAIDPRGFGDSDKPATGYDLETSAADIHAFIAAAGLARPGGVDIVSHDVGTWIAYTHARLYPGDVRRLVLSDARVPGMTAAPAAAVPTDLETLRTWQFAFNRLDTLPEVLIQGHERAFLTWFFSVKTVRRWTVDAATLDEYVRNLSAPGAARAGFEYYRVNFSDDAIKRAADRNKIGIAPPVLTVGAESGVGDGLAKSLVGRSDHAQGVILKECGHFVPEECPTEFMAAILDFWSKVPAPSR
jgi:pimeloyl-ACP methyl ester carboxylesterase